MPNTEKQDVYAEVANNTVANPEVADSLTFAVDPVRLAPGNWGRGTDDAIGEGDIAASYSADRIAMGQSIRKPFRWQGSDWVCVSTQCRDGVQSAQAYRVVHATQFPGNPASYRDKTRDGDAARSDPNGFYHGTTVTHAAQQLVLCGPAAIFLAGQRQQLDLFDCP
jgi:hypothetical protein